MTETRQRDSGWPQTYRRTCATFCVCVCVCVCVLARSPLHCRCTCTLKYKGASRSPFKLKCATTNAMRGEAFFSSAVCLSVLCVGRSSTWFVHRGRHCGRVNVRSVEGERSQPASEQCAQRLANRTFERGRRIASRVCKCNAVPSALE